MGTRARAPRRSARCRRRSIWPHAPSRICSPNWTARSMTQPVPVPVHLLSTNKTICFRKQKADGLIRKQMVLLVESSVVLLTQAGCCLKSQRRQRSIQRRTLFFRAARVIFVTSICVWSRLRPASLRRLGLMPQDLAQSSLEN